MSPEGLTQLSLLDLYSRHVVGWAMSDSIDAELALAALRMAASTRPLIANWIHHTDRDNDHLEALERLGAWCTACHGWVANT